MNKRIFVWIFVVFLLVSSVVAENDEKVDWEKSGVIQYNPVGFAQEIGITSIGGALGGVSYSKGKGTITNGGITVFIENIIGADIIALVKGGFEIKKEGKSKEERTLKIGENTYEFDGKKAVRFNNDGSVGLPKGVVMKSHGRTITTEEGLIIVSSKELLKISGQAIIKTEDGRVVKGSDLTLYFLKTIPNIKKLSIPEGNHIYLAENNKFILKGKGEISIKNDGGIANTYKGEHEGTIIWTGEENKVHIDNKNKKNFGIRTTIARSWHDTVIKNKKTKEEEKVTIQGRYVSKEGRIFILLKATDLGKLGEVSNKNYEIIKVPGIQMDVGDKKPFELDNPDFIMDRVLVSSTLNPKYNVVVNTPDFGQRERGMAAELIVKKSLGTAKGKIQIDPQTLQELISKYKNDYQGPTDERNEDFIHDLIDQERFEIIIETSVKGGGFTKGVGKFFSIFGAKTDPDKVIRESLIEVGKESGLSGSDWDNYMLIVKKYKVDQILVFSSRGSGQPTMGIFDKKGKPILDKNNEPFIRGISKEGIGKIKEERIGILTRDKRMKPELQKLANELLK